MSRKNYNGRDIVEDPIIRNYFQRFGTASSVGLLHLPFQSFTDSAIDGLIGYRLEHDCAVTFGDPLCAKQDKIALAQAFNDHCKKHNNKNIYAMTSEAFTKEALASFNGSALQIGHEIIIDPTIDVKSLPGSQPSQLRQKFRHAISHGLSAHEYKDTDPAQEETFKNIAKVWLSHRKGIQSFIQPVDVFSNRSNKRWFYAEMNSKIVGFLMLSKLPVCNGWMLNNGIMHTSDAPNSISEFLVLHALDTLRQEGCSFFSNGPTLAPNIEQLEGFDWFSHLLISYGLKSALKMLKLNDRQRFWNKFQPRKEPSYLTFTSSHFGLQEARALIKAFNVTLKKH